MSILDEAIAESEEKEFVDLPQIDRPAPVIPQKKEIAFFDILKTKTASGSIEEYQDHALNFKKSKGIAQIIRGMTGMCGELDLAIVDIVLGAFQYTKEGKGGASLEAHTRE